MIDELRALLVDKLLILHRYKKNLIYVSDLEDEVSSLQQLYQIAKWVKEPDWQEYIRAVESVLGVVVCNRIQPVQTVSPVEELEVVWLDDDGIIQIPNTPVITTTEYIATTTVPQTTVLTTIQSTTTQSTTSTTVSATTTTQTTTPTTTIFVPVGQTVIRNAFGVVIVTVNDGTLVEAKNGFGERLGLFPINDIS